MARPLACLGSRRVGHQPASGTEDREAPALVVLGFSTSAHPSHFRLQEVGRRLEKILRSFEAAEPAVPICPRVHPGFGFGSSFVRAETGSPLGSNALPRTEDAGVAPS